MHNKYGVVRLHKPHSGSYENHNSGFHATNTFSQTRVGLQCGSHFSPFKVLCLGCQMPRPCQTHRPQRCQHGVQKRSLKRQRNNVFSSPHPDQRAYLQIIGGGVSPPDLIKKRSPWLPEPVLWHHGIKHAHALQITLGTRVRMRVTKTQKWHLSFDLQSHHQKNWSEPGGEMWVATWGRQSVAQPERKSRQLVAKAGPKKTKQAASQHLQNQTT